MEKTVRGGLSVSNNVIADIVGHAVMECYGVVGMAAPTFSDGIAKILPASKYRRGVVIGSVPEGITVNLYVVLEYGCNIAVVSENLRDRIAFVLREIAFIEPHSIDVHIQGMRVRD